MSAKMTNGLRAYCQNCTDSQLRNVYADEMKRASLHRRTTVGRIAAAFAAAAEREMYKRGLTVGD